MHNHDVTGAYGDRPHKHIEKHLHIGTNLTGDIRLVKKVVLVGNPNVGKSLFFNHFSGVYVDVSNYPGTTVEITSGKYGNYEIYDTPGIYGVSSFTDEEQVARDIILDADIILNVVDSVHIERDLFLTQQLIDMGKEITVLLNFKDELKRQGIELDAKTLSDTLGVPVFQTSAITKGMRRKERPSTPFADPRKPEVDRFRSGSTSLTRRR